MLFTQIKYLTNIKKCAIYYYTTTKTDMKILIENYEEAFEAVCENNTNLDSDFICVDEDGKQLRVDGCSCDITIITKD